MNKRNWRHMASSVVVSLPFADWERIAQTLTAFESWDEPMAAFDLAVSRCRLEAGEIDRMPGRVALEQRWTPLGKHAVTKIIAAEAAEHRAKAVR